MLDPVRSRHCRARIDATDYAAYAEPFVGMGGIFLRRRRKLECEVINDISGDVTTFYRVVREHHGSLMDTLRWLIASRAEFERQKALPAKHLTDVQRAARFLYLQRLAWGGRVTDQSFGVSAGLTSRFNVLRLERDLVDLHDRLAHVVVEQLPFADFIRRYDRPETLFYLDPPYWGSETDYGQNVFGRGDFDELTAHPAGIKGKFLVSLNDTPGVRASYAGFQMRSFETTYYSSGRPQRAGEILIRNDDLL